ncbi:MAG: hypothetical protein KKD77_22960, partial [Gammaproteobacteria bacterium]|nr:hypothetical protein [Gammaproteobacteria bacterium]
MNRGFSGGSIVWHDTFLTKTAKDKEANGRLSYEVCRLDYMRKKFWSLFSVPRVPQNKVRFN